MNERRPAKKWTVDSGQWTVDRVQNSTLISHPSSLIFHPSSFGFTLIELLVTIAIISILAGLSLGAMRYARIAAAEAKTKATIAKLNDIVMRQYESYMTRRVPIDLSELTVNDEKIQPKQAALLRYCALLDLMRMEMPERTYDVINGPLNIKKPDLTTGTPQSWTSRPALSQMFYQKYSDPNSNLGSNYRSAKYLYMWISMTYPEAMEQFSQNEIADIDNDGWPVFVDGWGMPIMFLRWAPGFLPANNPANHSTDNCDTDLQTGDAIGDHDPFDTQRIYSGNYRLIPLIYSAGADKKYGITATAKNPDGTEYSKFYNIDPSVDTLDKPLDPYATVPTVYGDVLIGSPSNPSSSDPGINRMDNIHNHRIEQK